MSDSSDSTHAPRSLSLVHVALLLFANFMIQYVFGAWLYLQHLGLTDSQVTTAAAVLAACLVLGYSKHYSRLTCHALLHPSHFSVRSTFALLVPPTLALVPILALLALGASTLMLSYFPLPTQQIDPTTPIEWSVSTPELIALCALLPAFEEMLFRGVILRAYLVKFPRWVAIGLSVLTFAVAHFNPYQLPLALVVGMLLGWLYERSRSLVPCIALHVAVNSAGAFASYLQVSQQAPIAAQVGAGAWLTAVALAGFGSYRLYRLLA